MLELVPYQIADLATRLLPRPAADRLTRLVARTAFAARVPARAEAERNQRLLAGGRDSAATTRARESFEHFALSLADFLRLGRLEPGRLVEALELRGAEHLERARASGRGVILVSAHLGNWEWGAAFLGSLGERVHVVARPHSSAEVDAFFAARRARFGVSGLTGQPLWVDAARVLRGGGWIAMMADRRVPGVGRSACGWAATLARRTGAVVLPAAIVRIGPGRYTACFEPPLSPAEAAGGGLVASLRRYLDAYPGQWCAFAPLADGLAP